MKHLLIYLLGLFLHLTHYTAYNSPHLDCVDEFEAFLDENLNQTIQTQFVRSKTKVKNI